MKKKRFENSGAKGRRDRPGELPGAPRPKRREGGAGAVYLYGIHSVEAALKNPARTLIDLWLTENAAHRLQEALSDCNVTPKAVSSQELDQLAGRDAVHQGALLKALPLAAPTLDDIPDQGVVLALDQVTDPHNVGAILRSAAVFGVTALIMTERHSPGLNGVLAKTASGGLEHVKVVLVTNLARALGTLGDRGFQRIGLDGEGSCVLSPSLRGEASVLVLGAEGKGLRRLTREHCDMLVRIPATGGLSSLNVSNAAAVALFALQDVP